jgi:uncharacterized protein YaeQ
MALKASIHKVAIQFSDLDRNYYSDHNLTVARHPSETDERMMVRVLAMVLNAPSTNDLGELAFGKDMWDADEPCLWQIDHTGLVEHWIDVGHPDEKRVMRASGRSKRVTLYCYGGATTAWWASVADKVSRAKDLTVWQIPTEQGEGLAALVDRAMDLQITLQDSHLYVATDSKTVEITMTCLTDSNRLL